MSLTPNSKKGNESLKRHSPTNKEYDPVIFSRKRTFTNPHIARKSTGNTCLANVIHQSDSNGRATTFTSSSSQVRKPELATKPTTTLTKLINNLYNVLGLHEQVQHSPSTPSRNDELPKYVGILPPLSKVDEGKKCLVLDLDETLVHSSFKPTEKPDYIIPVDIEGNIHNVYVSKRPGVDEFLKQMGQIYEVVVFTASLSKYANPLLDQLDIHKVVKHRLFRQHCVMYEGAYVKDLSLLGREISQIIIIDNSPTAYLFHPQNAIDCSSYIDNEKDDELEGIGKFLSGIEKCDDVRVPLPNWKAVAYSSPTTLIG